MQVHPHIVQILHIDQHAALALAQIHQTAHIVVGRVQVHIHKGLFLLDDIAGIRVAGGVIDHLHRAVGQSQAVAHAGGGGDDVQIKLPLQTLGDDLHVQQTQEAAAEAKAQRGAGLQLKGQGGIVQLQFFQRVLQVGVFGTIGRVDAAEHHGLDLTVAGQCFCGGALCQRDGIAHAGVLHRLDAGGQVAYLTGLQLGAGSQGGGTHVTHLHQRELCAGSHHADGVAGLHCALEHADVDDDALVAVVDAVENQRL